MNEQRCGTCRHYVPCTVGDYQWEYGDCTCPLPDVAKEDYVVRYREDDMGQDCECWEGT